MEICDTMGVRGSYSETAAADYDRSSLLGSDGKFHVAMASTHHGAISVGHSTTQFQNAATLAGIGHREVPPQQELEMQ